MSRPNQALILAAHGAGDESPANRSLRDLAKRLRERNESDEVIAAFNLGSPRFAEALDLSSTDRAVVVPVMISDGYFRRTVLPRELARNRRFAQVKVRVTPPVGAHSALPDIFGRRVDAVMRADQLVPHKTAVIVVGHGTERDPRSAATTNTLRDALAKSISASRIESAFLDQSPRLDELPDQLTERSAVVIPFFIGGGFHATRDIANRLRLIDPHVPRRRYRDRNGRRFFLVDALTRGTDLDEIVWDLATNTASPVSADGALS